MKVSLPPSVSYDQAMAWRALYEAGETLHALVSKDAATGVARCERTVGDAIIAVGGKLRRPGARKRFGKSAAPLELEAWVAAYKAGTSINDIAYNNKRHVSPERVRLALLDAGVVLRSPGARLGAPSRRRFVRETA